MNKKRYNKEKLTLDIGDDVEPEIAYVDFEHKLQQLNNSKVHNNIKVKKANLDF